MKAAALTAIGGPALVGAAVFYASARPSALALVIGGALAVAAIGASVVLAVRRRLRLVLGAAASNLVLALFLSTYCAAPLPAAPPLAGELPAASPPADMAVFQVPTGVTVRTAAFGYRGGSIFDEREFAMTAVLVKHPRGDLLIDTGFGRDIAAQLELMPLPFRAVTAYRLTRSAADQLAAAGYELSRLRGIVLTHAHWDHVSGIPDFPGTPVMVTAAERRFVEDGGWITAVARSVAPQRFVEYGFEGGPYLGFPRSHDVYGDGAIVIVPAPGHTPGSVIVFLASPDGSRRALIGDLAWQQEGVLERAERPWLVRVLSDDDPAEVRTGLVQIAAIAARFPAFVIAPAHDPRGFAGLPSL